MTPRVDRVAEPQLPANSNYLCTAGYSGRDKGLAGFVGKCYKGIFAEKGKTRISL